MLKNSSTDLECDENGLDMTHIHNIMANITPEMPMNLPVYFKDTYMDEQRRIQLTI